MSNGERKVTDYDRVTDYGDDAVARSERVLVAQADKAVKPKKKGGGAAGGAASTKKKTVRILFFDPKGLLKNQEELRNEFSRRVEQGLNGLQAKALGADYLSGTLRLTFKVSYQARDTTKQEREGFGKLDYPIYFFNGHSPPDTSASEISKIMKGHKIGTGGIAASQYKQAEEGWQAKSVEGLGIQPLKGYRKVGFIKADRIFDTSKDFEASFTNVVKHELGHMFGKKQHGKGVMSDSILSSDSSLDYVDGDQLLILVELGRLISNSQKKLDAQYTRQTQ